MDREKQFYDLLAYFAASTKEVYENPRINAPNRLLAIMQRMLEFFADDPELDRAFLLDAQELILRNRPYLLTEPTRFTAFLDELTMKIAAKSML